MRKSYSLKDFADTKLLLVVFTCNHCPTAQAYESRIMQLHADYKDRGVALVAICPNDDRAIRLDELGYTDRSDSLEEMKARAKDRGFRFPYLYDGDTQKTSLAYGVEATPEVFLFDAERKLRYVGRIDNSDVKEVTSHDARNALDALLAGKKPPVQQTRTFGCSTKWSGKRVELPCRVSRCATLSRSRSIRSTSRPWASSLMNDTDQPCSSASGRPSVAPRGGCCQDSCTAINRMYLRSKFRRVSRRSASTSPKGKTRP